MANIIVDIESKATQISPIQDIGLFVSNIVGVALAIASIATFVLLVWGGLEWIMAGGDKNKLESARSRITNALVGLAIVAIAWAVFIFVDYFLGLDLASAGGGEGGGGSGGSGGGGGGNVGYCACSNGGCVSAGTIGPIVPGGACYTCQTSGNWGGSLITGPSCPHSITCGACS